jgi:uncharacterized surface protein with fasciclin (FAS1) repeats
MSDEDTITAVLEEQGDFSTFLTALDTAQAGTTPLLERLTEEGPYTVFAPTDAVFEQFDEETLQSLLEDEDVLTDILRHHILEGVYTTEDGEELAEAETLYGTTLSEADGGILDSEGNIAVEEPDIQAANGVIHVIDTLIIPADVELPTSESTSSGSSGGSDY